MLGVEYQDAVHLAVGDKDAVVVVDAPPLQSVPKCACLPLPISSTVAGFGVEDEHRSHTLVGRIDRALRIDCHSVGHQKLEGEILGLRVLLRLAASQPIHPGRLGLSFRAGVRSIFIPAK